MFQFQQLLMKSVCSVHALIVFLAFLPTFLIKANPTFAQIVPDNTLGAESSQVVPRDDNNSERIEGGAARGANLFHSFQEFNVDENRGTFFANPEGIGNIFSRVTGANSSNILGTLGVEGAANLYLINPNGIIFGENSALDVQGSFTATTADAITFDQGGLFSAVNPEDSVLTISVPLGLQLGSNPGSIINESFVQDEAGEFVGLQVPTGENLTFVGGEIVFEAGEATASGGNIFLGGLSEAGTVGIDEDGSLIFPEFLSRADITLNNAADIDVRGTGGGNVEIDVGNLTLEAGDFGTSVIRAGITSNSTSPEAQAGNIKIDATGEISLNNSFISNRVDQGGTGNSGEISITTNSLIITNGGIISASTLGQGNAGTVEINASGDLLIDGEDSDDFSSSVSSTVIAGAEGDAGEISILADSLTLTNGGRVSSSIAGQGNAGEIEISVLGDLLIDGENSSGIPSLILSSVVLGAEGNAGDIRISTDSLTLTKGGTVSASNFGQGNGGEIVINVSDDLLIDGENSSGFSSSIASNVGLETLGNSGGIRISAGSLTITNGGEIDAITQGQGNAGEIEINVSGDLLIDGENSSGIPSIITSFVAAGAAGNAGGISISADSLTLTNGAIIDASTFGQGNGGAVEISVSGDLLIDGENSSGFSSIISSTVLSEAIGNSGGIRISADSVSLANETSISTFTVGQGDAGTIEIDANSITLESNAQILSESDSDFNAADISLSIAESLQLTDGTISTSSTISSGGNLTINAPSADIQLRGDSDISTNISSGAGSGGNITIVADSIIAFDDSDIFAFAADGQGGNIILNTDSFFAENFSLNSLAADPNILDNNDLADVNATGAFSGVVDIPDVSFLQNALSELNNNSIDTEQLLANSCVVPNQNQEGTFLITGKGGLVASPEDESVSNFATGDVQTIEEKDTSYKWRTGDPIVEPQGVYRLSDGRLVMSRECKAG